MQITRLYYNAGEELLRKDEINFVLSYPTHELVTYSFDEKMKIVPRENRTTRVFHGVGARVVNHIEIFGTYQDIESVSDNFEWATWTLGNGQVITCDMSNLPAVGDTL